MFFESTHSLTENEFRLSFSKSITFPFHLHRSFEFYAQLEGSSEVTVGEKTYTLSAGEAVLIFPFQIHAYRSESGSTFAMCIFSPDLASDFYKKTAHKEPTDALFRYTVSRDIPRDNIFLQRSIVYGICGTFDRDRVYRTTTDSLYENPLAALLLYADKYFRSECLLSDAATKVGYDYAYVSKLFKRKVGISFRAYVNLLRVNESKRLLKETMKSMNEIMEESGFRSLRTFDRAFLRVTGLPPSAYRSLHMKS